MFGNVLGAMTAIACASVFLYMRAFNSSSESLKLWVLISVIGTFLAFTVPGLWLALALTISAIALVVSWADP